MSEHRVTKIRTVSKEVNGKQPFSCPDLARGSAVKPWSAPSSTEGCSGLHIWRSSYLFHSLWMDFRMGRSSLPASGSGSLPNLFFGGTHSITLAPFCRSSLRIVSSPGPTELCHVPSVVYFLYPRVVHRDAETKAWASLPSLLPGGAASELFEAPRDSLKWAFPYK